MGTSFLFSIIWKALLASGLFSVCMQIWEGGQGRKISNSCETCTNLPMPGHFPNLLKMNT